MILRNMNKKILLTSLVFFIIFTSGCTSQKPKAVEIKPDSNIQVETDNTEKTSAKIIDNTVDSNSIRLDAMTYDLAKNVYTDKNVTIDYPQIINLGDGTKQKLINEVIKNEALKVLRYYKDNTGEVYLKIDYDIKFKGKNLLSLQYSGIGYVKGAAHPNNLLYTTNIDINKASRLSLADIVNIDENFVNKFRNSSYKSQEADKDKSLEEAAKLSIKQYTTADLIKNFKNADSLDNIGTGNQSDTFSYFTKDSLGISVSLSSAAGGHAEFEIKYQDIQDNINTKNEVWKNLLGL